MPTLRIGETEIHYEVRASARARHLRIVATPGKVEVVVPPGAGAAEIERFVEVKRRWIYNQTERLRERALLVAPRRFVSGAKVLFRGRLLNLRLRPAEVEVPRLRYATGFEVEVPETSSGAEREAMAESLITAWLKDRVEDDARYFARRHAATLGVEPRSVRLSAQKLYWGTCGKDGVIRLHWRLVGAPRAVLEYVVAHELCHLQERHHGPRFWRLVATLLPDYETRHAWLERHGLTLE